MSSRIDVIHTGSDEFANDLVFFQKKLAVAKTPNAQAKLRKQIAMLEDAAIIYRLIH